MSTFEGVDEWADVPLRDILSERFELPVYLAHDPECLLTSTDFDGDSMLIRIDYGVGMAVKKDGMLISSEGMPEIGRTAVIDNDGRICGRLYDYVTVGGIEKRGGCSLDEILNSDKSKSVFDDMALKLGGALSNAMLIFDVEKVFICGKMTDYKDMYFEKMCSVIKECCGDNASVEIYDVKRAAIGAAHIATDKKILVL